MNPFDLSGPAFLLVYAVATAAVAGALVLIRRVLESGPVPKIGEPDPYLIAHLRGGADEAFLVATLALLDRGLLTAMGTELVAEAGAAAHVRRPIERAVLDAFSERSTVHAALARVGAGEVCASLHEELRRHGLVPRREQVLARVVLGVVAVAVLWTFAAIKVAVAFSRGRHNVWFLVLLAVAAPVVVAFVLKARRTPVGDRVLTDLATLFGRLRARAKDIQSGGATNELALLVGVYGMAELWDTTLRSHRAVFARPKGDRSAWASGGWYDASRNDTSTQSSSCSVTSSCSTSSCSSSSCGGGCGGGCGGCGS
jgi:uncharacterized protein (TIGR04222 family)